MRKDSPLVACSIAALIVLVVGLAVMPASAWRTASSVASLVSTVGGHGTSLARAARVGVLAAPGLLRETPAVPERRAPRVRVCRREVPRSCVQSSCPRQFLQRIQLIFPIRG
jgi:hypothetical protein